MYSIHKYWKNVDYNIHYFIYAQSGGECMYVMELKELL